MRMIEVVSSRSSKCEVDRVNAPLRFHTLHKKNYKLSRILIPAAVREQTLSKSAMPGHFPADLVQSTIATLGRRSSKRTSDVIMHLSMLSC